MARAGLSVAVVLCLLPAAGRSADPAVPWVRLKSLAGTWQRADDGGRPGFRIRYRLISADTALVEEFGDPAKQQTQTVFHPDADRLLATHYCAQGNQPRLVLRPGTAPDTLVFEFLDATNLRSTTESHLVLLTLRWLDPDRLSREEVYAAGERREVSTLVLKRAR